VTDTVEIVRRSDNAVVEAVLVDQLEPPDLLIVERVWGPVRSRLLAELTRRNVPRHEWPESLHWDWGRKAVELKLLEATGFGIVCEDTWQGVMLTRLASHVTRLAEDRGKPLIYIDYLEAAPWNWIVPPLGERGQYRGIGSVLIRRAVMQSEDEGFHGRVGLHALPQAVAFYQKACGMTLVAQDANKENLMYFEFTRAQAEAFMEKGGAK
jgi:hypothetical protein